MVGWAERPWRPGHRGASRDLLAGLLLAMAAGQVSDAGGFARILDAYRALPGTAPTIVAWALILAEAGAGVALLRRARLGASLAVAVALSWTVLGLQAFTRGLPLANCGCFGVHLGQPLRWWVLAEDGDFVALAVWVRRAERRAGPQAAPQLAEVGPVPTVTAPGGQG